MVRKEETESNLCLDIFPAWCHVGKRTNEAWVFGAPPISADQFNDNFTYLEFIPRSKAITGDEVGIGRLVILKRMHYLARSVKVLRKPCPSSLQTTSRNRTAITRTLQIMPSQLSTDASLKVLMLHGYTQSGDLFHAKTRVLEKHLQKAFKEIKLSYPTGPLRLNPADVPGFNPTAADPDDISAWGWWRRSDISEPPEYVGIEKGLQVLADVLEKEGPFDGVMGFSQGAALAAMIASLLEGDTRKEAFKKGQEKSTLAIPYPSSFASLIHPPLKFCIQYSGFVAPGERYKGFYENPTIQTPVCHFLGSLDSVVEEKRSLMLIDACGGPEMTQVVTHPGGHFVPTSKQYLDIMVAFIKNHMGEQYAQDEKQEERVEDMEVPF